VAKKAEKQKQYVLGAEYLVTGPSGKVRKLVFRGRLRIGTEKFLVFRPVRATARRTPE
jgi:hypothetical protein